MSDTLKREARNLLIVLVLFAVGMLTVYSFDIMNIRTLVVFPVFILGILIAILETDRGLWGGVLSVAYLVCYDFFYVEPLYGLRIFSRTEIIALAIFTVVSLIMSSITRRMRKQVEIAERNALIMARLNKVSTGLINSTSKQEACEYTQTFLCKFLKREVVVMLGQPGEDASHAERVCYQENCPTGAGVVGWSEYDDKFIPLSSRGSIYGVVRLDCSEDDLDDAGREFLRSVITQTVIAIERNELEDEKRASEVRIERERFKTSLLRSVSHDLRTPLTSIAGNTDFLLRNPDLDEKTRSELLGAVADDAEWLGSMFDNLLGLTRVEEAEEPLQKSPEILDEIIGDAVARERRRLGEHELRAETADDYLIVPMDGKLISQVLVNLIDNALKHSSPTSAITVSSWVEGGWAHVSVSDDEGGIDPDKLDSIFTKFYTTNQTAQGRRGMGLGLSICEAIVKAHGGSIVAYNNEEGGATFEFTLPLDEGEYHDPE